MNRVILDPYKILISHDAVYQSPVSANGELLGPLVGYAGTYVNDKGEKENYVGSAYFNMAKVEEDSFTRCFFADNLACQIKEKFSISLVLIGAPMGGIIFTVTIADILKSRATFFEKKESELVFNRHTLKKGDKVILVEDLVNNFSTTNKMIKIVTNMGAEVKAIACVFNRSPYDNWEGIPVISVIHKSAPEFKQNDPVVKKLIEAGNIVWKPKAEWPRLKAAMQTV
ncbi:MAG: hypothetical protein WCT51_03055 [Candidatus Shapirobacteria bacterium]|jgi:orotate phosphoribosyltransferase